MTDQDVTQAARRVFTTTTFEAQCALIVTEALKLIGNSDLSGTLVLSRSPEPIVAFSTLLESPELPSGLSGFSDVCVRDTVLVVPLLWSGVPSGWLLLTSQGEVDTSLWQPSFQVFAELVGYALTVHQQKAQVAHDLKTPLTTIRGYAQLISKKLEAGESVDAGWSRTIDEVAEQMATELSKLES